MSQYLGLLRYVPLPTDREGGHHNKVFEILGHLLCAVPCKNMFSGICRQQRPRSACASVQSDQGFQCRLTESLDTIEFINGEQMPG